MSDQVDVGRVTSQGTTIVEVKSGDAADHSAPTITSSTTRTASSPKSSRGIANPNYKENGHAPDVTNGPSVVSFGAETDYDEAIGSTVSFHDINYTLNLSSGFCKTSPKTILNDVNGIFKPGMNAILGATGSGKSSLLDVLAGRKDPIGLQGVVLIDGQMQPANFKCMSGYVVQDDVVMGTLSVRENFHFSAALRLPSHVKSGERKRRVEETLTELGLLHCADTLVGTELIRGVSGGERKRTNIGMELIIQPAVLFLDEPTTGLDANTANSVMILLKRLSVRGRTIIFSIHQPRYSIFRLFDSLMLLSNARMVYHGPATDALDFFETLGYHCEEHNNPPDFFLDVINGDMMALKNPDEILGDYEAVKGMVESTKVQQLGAAGELAIFLNEQYMSSPWNKRMTVDLNEIFSQFLETLKLPSVNVRQVPYVSSFFTQFVQVSKRSLLNIVRNPQTGIMQLLVMLVFGAVVGAIYWQVNDSEKSGIQNRVGAFFFIIMNMIFGNLSAVELFIKERPIFMHENSSGFYRVSAFFLAKVFCDTLPMRGLPTLIFATVTYWMIGFQKDAAHFFYYVLLLLLTTLSASGIAFAVSATVSVFAIANLLIALSYVVMMVFSGLLVNLSDLAAWLHWLKYLSIFRYALSGLSINELEDKMFCNSTDTTHNATSCTSGNSYLDAQDIQHGTTWDLWVNAVALGAMTLGFLALTYIQLLRLKKWK